MVRYQGRPQLPPPFAAPPPHLGPDPGWRRLVVGPVRGFFCWLAGGSEAKLPETDPLLNSLLALLARSLWRILFAPSSEALFLSWPLRIGAIFGSVRLHVETKRPWNNSSLFLLFRDVLWGLKVSFLGGVRRLSVCLPKED
jgi:hypothetical protein